MSSRNSDKYSNSGLDGGDTTLDQEGTDGEVGVGSLETINNYFTSHGGGGDYNTSNTTTTNTGGDAGDNTNGYNETNKGGPVPPLTMVVTSTTIIQVPVPFGATSVDVEVVQSYTLKDANGSEYPVSITNYP
ncbi:MAG: hypothetical protein DRR06_06045 [Gammaproteobacteria bacterium]|nr:MAG: hypothetical protein DRR06_06045 [Gammaproteobacteria bacterium]